MGIFSRRNLHRILLENTRFVRQRPLSEHIKRLNGNDEVQRVTTEWEVVLLNGLSKLGSVDHEPKLPGSSKPDVLFTHSLGTALIDITSVSDRGLDQQNPIRELSNRLTELLTEQGFDPGHFGLKVEGNWPQLHIGGPKARLYIPRKKDFDAVIFNAPFNRFLDDIRLSPGLKREFRVATLDARVTITYDPARRFFSMSYLAYTVPFSATKNAIYTALEGKAIQLKLSRFKGLKGVVLCDAGCEALGRRGQRGLNLDASEIISTFLSNYRSIDFVLTMLVESDQSGLSGPEHVRILARAYVFSTDTPATPLVRHLCERLPQAIPNPENTPINSYGLENEGKSFSGGYIMSGQSIKISSRAVMGLLSGQTKPEDFMRENPHVKDRFARALREGRLLKETRIESCHHRDDDWIEFSFSEPDPAISPFPALRSQRAR
jgi:hypothetical protein